MKGVNNTDCASRAVVAERLRAPELPRTRRCSRNSPERSRRIRSACWQSARRTTCETSRVSEVLIKEGDSFEAALKKFTRKVQQDGLLSEAKRRQHYEPPSVKRKRKADARERKARKARAKATAQGL